ncbi:hypothetical protein KIW84_040779 [Lathyrus oleraceus]|uniref:Uncharacterized protein n=1 Tax=Pisum sativum TaxID=3888 RepID=A0A9D4X8E7_PEA|nr:hypothetical protein KIW84_040779 [Pisum sativum]
MFFEISSNFIIGNSLIVLSRDENSVDTNRNHGTLVIVILNSDLSLTIRSQPSTSTILTNLSQTSTELGCKNVTQRHQLRSLISSITKHMTLVTSTNFLRLLGEMTMHTLSNIRTLLLNIHKNLAVVSIKTHICRNKPNIPAGVTDNLLIINISLGCDLSKNHNQVSLGAGFTCNLAV